MGLDSTTYLIMGTEIDFLQYFEAHQEEGSNPIRCEHQELHDAATKYCPSCGRQRPDPESLIRLCKDKLPPAFLEAAQEMLGSNLDVDIREPRDFEGYMGTLPNGLYILSNEGESCDEPHYYLGGIIETFYEGASDVHVPLDLERFTTLKTDVEQKASELGFGGEAKLVMYTKVM